MLEEDVLPGGCVEDSLAALSEVSALSPDDDPSSGGESLLHAARPKTSASHRRGVE